MDQWPICTGYKDKYGNWHGHENKPNRMRPEQKKDSHATWRFRCNLKTPFRCYGTQHADGLEGEDDLPRSFTKRVKIPLNQVFTIIWAFCADMEAKHVSNLDINISRESVTSVSTWIKECCQIKLYDDTPLDINGHQVEDPHMIGGEGMEVQIDEKQVARRKNNTGHVLAHEGEWLVGGIDEAGNVFGHRVPDRSRHTIIPLIRRFVKPGSIILTDGWASYVPLGLPGSGYRHKTVNHTINFVNPEDGTCTNRVERLWRDLDTHIDTHQDDNGQLDRDIAWYLFKKNYFHREAPNRGGKSLKDRVIDVLQCIREVYPGVTETPVKSLPDWIMFFKDEDFEDETKVFQWSLETHGRGLRGYNVVGLQYSQFCGAACEWCQLEDE